MRLGRASLSVVLVIAAACNGPEAPWTAAPATKIDLKVRVEPSTVQLLQPVTVTLDLFTLAGVDAEFSPQVDGKDFAVTIVGGADVALFGGTWRRTTLRCKPLRGPGELLLPSFVANSKDGVGSASVPEQKITVVTTLAGAAAAIEAPGEPFPTPFQGWWWIAAAAAGLVACVGTWWLLRARHTARPEAHAVAVPPHVKALRALQRLHAASRTTRGEIESFYVEVSQVLRVYLEERFALCAPERTTEEFLRELEGGDQLAKDHRTELERFLSQCDLVKFAAFVPSEGDHLTTWALAATFVEATRSDRARAVAEAVA